MKTEFTKSEWFEVAKAAKPGISDVAYNDMWDGFVRFKSLSKQEQRAELDLM